MTMRTSLATIVLLLCACGGGEVEPLSGSLTQVTDLDYQRATLETTDGAMFLRFLKARGDQEDTVLKVAVTTTGVSIRPGAILDLAEMLPDVGAQRGRASRNVYEDPNDTLPAMTRGTLKLTSDPLISKIVTGEVSMTFVQGNVFGSGRAVFGPFAAEVQK